MVRIQTIVILSAGLLVGAGCGINKATHQKALDSLTSCQVELDETKQVLGTSKTKVAQLEDELKSTRSDRDKKSQAAREREERIQKLLGEMGDAEAELLKLKAQQAQAEQRLAGYRALNERLRQLVDTGKLEIAFRNGQMILQLPSNVLFDSGKANLSKGGKAALSEVLSILLEFKDRRFQVAGHTDNVPIRSRQFRNNWQLSTARAVSVLEAMVEAGFDSTNLSATGFGEFDPIASNETDEGKQQNRRIEIILVPDLSELPNLANEPS
ncbi:MAG TPA: OmpA family protein [Kofleriaceae bacterium]|nr:OmpA family protein [Kofleriaceae bacterium]